MTPKQNEKSTLSFDYHVLFYAIKNGKCQKVKDLLNKNCLVIDDKWIDYKLLVYALKCQCQLSIVEYLVKKGCRVRGPRTKEYKTPLYYAVEGKKMTLMQFLLKAGASICDKDLNQDTPLYFALKENYFKAVDLMLSMYDVDNIDPNSDDEKRHFSIACMRNSTNLVKCFLGKGIDINAVQRWFMKKWSGYTPLHFAVDFQRKETVKILLLHGANVNSFDDWNSTPLHLAVINRSVAVVELLLNHGSDFTKQNKNGMTPLHLAFDIDETKIKFKIVDMILQFHGTNIVNPIDNRKLSHFHISCARNNVAVVKAFLESGVDINRSITLHNSPAGISPLHLAVDFQQTEIVKILLLHGANVNSVDDRNSTPLHLAVEGGYQEITKSLLEYGADANLKNQKNLTPLHLAVKYKLIKIVKLLLQNGGNPSIGDQRGVSPIHMAYFGLPSSKEILDMMLSMHQGKLTNTSDTNNFSIFHIACMLNKVEVVKEFLQGNIDVDASVKITANKWPGFTPLHFAAYFYNYDLTQLLLQSKANVNLKEKNGYTPLWLAVKFRFNDEIANKLNKNILKNKSSYKDASVDEDRVMNYLFEEIKQPEIIYALASKSNLNSDDANGRPLLLEACFPEISWNFSDNIANKSFVMSICSTFYDKNLKLNLKILIKHGIDLSITDKNNVPILLHVADKCKCTNAYLHIDEKFFESSQKVIMDLLMTERNKTTPLKRVQIDAIDSTSEKNVENSMSVENESLCKHF